MNFKHIVMSVTMVLSMPCAWGERVIVPTDFKRSSEFHLASQFLNKYASLLNETQTETTKDAIRRTKEDGLRFLKGSDVNLKTLTGTEDFSMSFENGIYSTEWSKNGQALVSCTFPANIVLLTFSNKIELENQLIKSLSDLSDDSLQIETPVRDTSNLTPVAFSDFYIEDKGFYITPRLKHQLIFEKSKTNLDSCVLLTDSTHYQLESIANMMLSGYSGYHHPINLKVNKYGNNSQPITSSLAILYSFLSEDGSIPYWGVETFDGKTVKGLWIWINRQGGFAHMLTATVPISSLSTSASIDAKLHCYLRLDNLKSLFEEYPDL